MSPRRAHHVAAAVVRRGDEVVLVLQGDADEEPFWGLPGGVVEEDELVPEGLVREVLEETGLTIHLPARLGYIQQIDNRAGDRYVATVWLFDVDSWDGEIGAQDPDGVVHEAHFVPLGEAVERLRRTDWLGLAADYLEGSVEPGSLRFERWNEDGSASR